MNTRDRLVKTLCQRFPTLVAPRSEESHKGSYGTVVTVGGTAGMSGAVCLAASAAMYLGCGKSIAVFCQPRLPFPIIPGYPEIMLKTAADSTEFPQPEALLIGCGMGVSRLAQKISEQFIAYNTASLVIDADALNLLARGDIRADKPDAQKTTRILTPHPTEAARLLGSTTEAIQKQRATSAARLAEKYHGWIVLKGHRSVIASPQGEITVNDSGNAGLATAGSGDVLGGMIASLLAQGLPPREAVFGAVWLHGAAAEFLGQGIAMPGLLAGEIAPAARALRQSAMLE